MPAALPALRAGRAAALVCVLLAAAVTASAETVTVAVAANFRVPLEAIGLEFEAATEHELAIVSGSTGQLYAQIVNGAPFDVLLAADRERPRLLAEAGIGDPSTLFTYATGRLVLWSRDPDRVGDDTLGRLGELEFRWLAIANPDLAPYGLAARDVLEALGIWDALGPRLVSGQSVAQAFAMAATGSAELAFVALSQATAYDDAASYTVVPQALHAPIRQDAIVLARALENPAAIALIAYLKGDAAATTMHRFGYEPGGG